MIHQYKLGNYNIVLDVCSGSVHAVDEVAYDIIAMFENKSREEILTAMEEKYAGRKDISKEDIAECYAQVVGLKEAGKLFAPDTFEPMAGKLKEKTSGVVKALCLHVAHTCNLNCEYCFASQGKYHGERALMSFEVGKRALDFLIENSGTRRNLEVDFFGEELLAGKSTKIEWLKPVFAKDVLTGKATVTNLIKRSPKNGIVEITIEAYNQNGELVLTDITEAIVKCRKA